MVTDVKKKYATIVGINVTLLKIQHNCSSIKIIFPLLCLIARTQYFQILKWTGQIINLLQQFISGMSD